MYIMSPVTGTCEVSQCTRLFRNAFRIKGTPESTIKKSSKRVKRLLGMASSNSSTENSPSCSTNQTECAAMFSSPISSGQNSTPHKPCGLKSAKARLPLEEFDPNSQDSGYGGCHSDEKKPQNFRFAEPSGVAPRRLSLDSRSPMKSPVRSSPQRKRFARPSNLFRSLSSGYESTDDGFNDLIDMESLENETSQALPSGMTSLICGSIVNEKPMELDVATTPEATSRPSFNFRRSTSLQFSERSAEEECSPPSIKKVRSCLFRSPSAASSTAKILYDQSPKRRRDSGFESPTMPSIIRKFKRPEPPAEHTPLIVKKSRKCTSNQDVSLTSKCDSSSEESTPPPLLMRSLSETEAHAHIKSAITRSTTDADLTGDFSKPCALPLAEGQHEDLKSISSETLSRLIKGDFDDSISDFKIVDCRYPYEYEAGHIEGALNLYTQEMVEEKLLEPLTHAPAIEPETHKRQILVFHCEFSWERGPKLSRFLRKLDRQKNKEHYPALHYPEIYLLHGGYKRFFKEQLEHCSPQAYMPMSDPEHEAELKIFRSKSKSWQGEKVNRANVVTARANLKRLGF